MRQIRASELTNVSGGTTEYLPDGTVVVTVSPNPPPEMMEFDDAGDSNHDDLIAYLYGDRGGSGGSGTIDGIASDLFKRFVDALESNGTDREQKGGAHQFDRDKAVGSPHREFIVGYGSVEVYDYPDGSKWFDSNNNGRPDVHYKMYSDGRYYDSDMDGSFDTKWGHEPFGGPG